MAMLYNIKSENIYKICKLMVNYFMVSTKSHLFLNNYKIWK